MSNLLRKYLKGDPILWVTFIMLCMLSIVEMYSASSTLAFKSSSYSSPVLKHAGFLMAGLVLAYLVHLVPYKYIRMMSYVGIVLSLVTLVFVQIRGVEANGAARWLVIGGVQFQPSELGKISLIILVADLIARIKNKPENQARLFKYLLAITFLVSGLILLENFSTAAILFFVVMLMIFIAKISDKNLVILGLAMTLGVVFIFTAFKVVPEDKMPEAFHRGYTWVNRIDRFSDKSEENKYKLTDENLQEIQGKIAIARGGFTGLMPGNSVQRDFLPQAYSDFIYAIIVEELGLAGGVFVIFIFMTLLFRAGMIATKSNSLFPAILVIGLSLIIVIQAFVSMAVSTSLGPVTGQPLPMVSRGGTSILITSVYFGIIIGVTRQIKEEKLKKEQPISIDDL